MLPKRLGLALSWVLLIRGIVAAGDDQPFVPRITVPEFGASFDGISPSEGIAQYLGIRYAHDTSGANRFRAPRRYAYEKGSITNASSSPLPCSQPLEDTPPFVIGRGRVGEDCLGLSITRPTQIPDGEKLPVLVWIHGGAILLGAGDDPLYNPLGFMQHAIDQKQPVIYVSFNYRLGLFGYAADEQLQDSGDTNVGLRDQRMALEWIADHIEAFGGDSSRITVYGQSAGGTTGAVQTMMFKDRPVPFHQLLSMSGPPGNAADIDYKKVPGHTTAVAKKLGCLNGGKVDFGCMRDVDHDELLAESLAYARALHPPFGMFTFLPIADGDSLAETAGELAKRSAMQNVTVLAGWTHDEASILVDSSAITSTESALTALGGALVLLSDEQIAGLFDLYPLSEFEPRSAAAKAHFGIDISPHWYQVTQIMSDVAMRCATISYARKVQRKWGTPVWLYELNQSTWTPLFAAQGMPHVGTAHGSDIPYSRNDVPQEISDRSSHVDMARRYMDMTLAFAYHGDPSLSRDFSSWSPSVLEDPESGEMVELRIQSLGGPLGDGLVTLKSSADDPPVNSTTGGFSIQDMAGIPQKILGAMKAPFEDRHAAERQRLFEAERLMERCAYIETLV